MGGEWAHLQRPSGGEAEPCASQLHTFLGERRANGSPMTTRLPFEIREAIVQVCGKGFHYKDPFRTFLLSCGVSAEMYDRYSEESKYKIARHVLSELDSLGDDGYEVQRRILSELCRLRRLPDDNTPDPAAGLDALRNLKQLAADQKLVVEQAESVTAIRTAEARRKQAGLAARAEKMKELREQFFLLSTDPESAQARGYGLEDILSELFAANEIPYRPSYKIETEQIDGHFHFKGFDYLVEARWRKGPPVEADLAALKTKADKKITSTRGLFVSVVGFRSEVVLEFTRGVSSNIILMDGSDLSLILEGHISLVDALDLKIEKAAQEGLIYFPLAQRFS